MNASLTRRNSGNVRGTLHRRNTANSTLTRRMSGNVRGTLRRRDAGESA